MASPPRSATGGLEAAVLEVLWDRDDWTSGADVHEALRDTHPVAYTTALTVLVRLCDKGLVQRKRFSGRAYRFRAMLSRSEIAARRIHEALGASGDRRAVLAHLIHELDPADRDRLSELLDSMTGED